MQKMPNLTSIFNSKGLCVFWGLTSEVNCLILKLSHAKNAQFNLNFQQQGAMFILSLTSEVNCLILKFRETPQIT